MSIAGLLIRRERLARAWSQEGLCRGICGTSYLSKIEQGKAAASEEVLALLFARLGLSWTDDADGALHAQTEACMGALFAGDAPAFAAAFARLRAQERTLLCSPCAADYLLLREFACEADGERRPLDAEFVSFLDQRQLALQRVLEGRHEEAALLYPAAAIRLWQGAHLYARGRYAAATEALRAAYDAAAAEGYAHIMMNCRVYLGNCCSDSGDPKRMQQHYAVAQRLAEALGDQKILATIRYNDAATKIECGDFAAAYAYFSPLAAPPLRKPRMPTLPRWKSRTRCRCTSSLFAARRWDGGTRHSPRLRGRRRCFLRAKRTHQSGRCSRSCAAGWKRRTICTTSATANC